MANLYALLVGINFYDADSYVPPLKGCNNDVKAFQVYLEERVKQQNFQLHLRVLLNQQATRQAVIDGFQQHLQKAGPDDMAFFFFAGHGAQAKAPEEFWPIEPDRMNETLVCYDSRTPDGWDLADKELAKLIADVAKNDPHIAVILDCCHSGSGTREIEPTVSVRQAPADMRQRPLDSFIVSLADVENLTVSRSPEESPSGWSLPRGRHVVLSACRDIEEAKEYSGGDKPHGAFSFFLMDTLQKANGVLTYRDLFKRANALIRSRVSTQSPQMEATHSEDLDRPFLGGAIADSPTYYTVTHHKDHSWVIDGGAVHGVAAPANGSSTLLALFPSDSAPEQLRQLSMASAEAEVTEVLPQLSKLKLTRGAEHLADTTATYKAVVIGLPLPSLTIALDGEEVGIQLVRRALQSAGPDGQSSLYVREATDNDPGSFRVLMRNGEYWITRPVDDRPLVTQIRGYTPENAAEVIQNLEHIARWTTVAELSSSSNSRIRGAVRLQLYPGEGGQDAAEEILDAQVRLEYQYNTENGTWEEPTFRVKLTNTSSETLFCALFDLSERFKVQSVLTGGTIRLAPGEEAWLLDGQPLYGIVPQALWERGVTEYKDILKLIACTDEFDPTLMEQPDLGEPLPSPTRSAGRGVGTLNRLMRRVVTREISARPESEELYDDWVANQVTFTFVRPQNAHSVRSDAAVYLGNGVTLQPHPSFQAETRLTTVSQSTRDLGCHILPPFLREKTQPLQFTSSLSTDPGLSSLELAQVTNLKAVTPETPLTLLANVPLDEDEYVLPVAYDGEFFLPLGYGKAQGNQTQITIERLPEPVSEGQRSLTGAIRIFFQKVVSRKLGTELSEKLGLDFQYPILAAADVEADQVFYTPQPDQVKARVSQAEKIVLFIHGIIGDTESMVPSVDLATVTLDGQSQSPREAYDLILTFDYESINTSTAMNALKLKQKLREVGLGSGHGKTLHIVAHSMGGLLSRWFIEQEDGHEVVQHLVMLGTPNAGSPWPEVQAGLTAAVGFALNSLSTVVWPLKLLSAVLEKIEVIDVPLDEMQPSSEFLTTLAASSDPSIPYSIVAGNTSRISLDDDQKHLRQRLMQKLGKVVELPFFGKPNDIAVTVKSITSVPKTRSPQPQVMETTCNHLVYFKDPAGLEGLSWGIGRALSSDLPSPDQGPANTPDGLGVASVNQAEGNEMNTSEGDSNFSKIASLLAIVALVILGLFLWNRSRSHQPATSGGGFSLPIYISHQVK